MSNTKELSASTVFFLGALFCIVISLFLLYIPILGITLFALFIILSLAALYLIYREGKKEDELLSK